MFRYNGKIADLLKDQVVLSDYTKDGYAPLQGEIKKIPEKKASAGASVQDTLKLHMMEEFIARLSQSDTRLIMVASPKYGATSSDIFDPIKEICSHYGVDFWDFYAAPEFQKLDYFKEPMHLNDKGTRVFSKTIANNLKQTLRN